MTSGLLDAVARIARYEAAARSVAAVGVVTDVFPAGGGPDADHAVTVKLRDSGLVLAKVPVGVGLLGFAAIPAVGDVVLVVFAEGDLHGPVVVGRLYHPDQPPPRHAEGQAVLRLPSPDGDKVQLVVDGAAPTVTLDLPGDVHLEIAEGKVRLEVGAIRLALDGSGGGRAQLAAGSSTVTVKKDGDMTIKATGNLTLEGANVEIKGHAKVTVKGAIVEVN